MGVHTLRPSSKGPARPAIPSSDTNFVTSSHICYATMGHSTSDTLPASDVKPQGSQAWHRSHIVWSMNYKHTPKGFIFCLLSNTQMQTRGAKMDMTSTVSIQCCLSWILVRRLEDCRPINVINRQSSQPFSRGTYRFSCINTNPLEFQLWSIICRRSYCFWNDIPASR